MITEQQSFGFDIRDAFFNKVSQDVFFEGYTAKKNKMLQVQPERLPYLGVYLVDETMTPDGDANAGCVRFSHTVRIGFSVIIADNDQDQAERLSDRAYLRIGTLLFTDPDIFNVVTSSNPEGVLLESVTRGTRRHVYGSSGQNNETPIVELQYDINCFFRTEWYPDITDVLEEIDVTTGVKADDTQDEMDQRHQVKVKYLGLYEIGSSVAGIIDADEAADTTLASGSVSTPVTGTISALEATDTASASGSVVADWTSAFYLPDGTHPSIVLDFVNQRYFDGSNNNASLASLVNNSPSVNANGMLCSATNFTSAGALTAAVQAAATVMVETFGGSAFPTAEGAVAFTTGAPDAPLITNDVSGSGAAYNGISSLRSNNGIVNDWTKRCRTASGFDSAGRILIVNDGFTQGTPVTDTQLYAARGQLVLGSWNNGFRLGGGNGRIRRLIAYLGKRSAAEVRALTWPGQYLFPLATNHMLLFVGGKTPPSALTLPTGALQFDKTQPWTFAGEIIWTGSQAVLFTNVINSPWYGYEVWIPGSGKIRVHLMSGWIGTGDPNNSLEVDGSTVLTAGQFYRIMVSYDGSGKASGIKIYINGVQDTISITADTLGSTIIGAPAQMWLGNQLGGDSFAGSFLGPFQLSKVARSSTYAAAIASSETVPAVDSDHVLSFRFTEGSGLTTADESSNHYTGTLSNAAAWNVW